MHTEAGLFPSSISPVLVGLPYPRMRAPSLREIAEVHARELARVRGHARPPAYRKRALAGVQAPTDTAIPNLFEARRLAMRSGFGERASEADRRKTERDCGGGVRELEPATEDDMAEFEA
eukprot:6178983-Pleurochrysis_carterae.AAC.1